MQILQRRCNYSSESGVVLRKVLVRVGVVNGLRRIASSETLSASLAVDVVVCATVPCEMRRFMDEGSTPGVGASNRGTPEGT